LNKEHQEGIKAFENCIKLCLDLGRSINEMNFENIGISKEDIIKIKAGEKYITEEQFYGFAQILMFSHIIPLTKWLEDLDHWGLVGILEPAFSLQKHINIEIISNIRAILDFPYVIINNPELQIEIHDSLIHNYQNGHKEEFFIIDINYSPYSRGRKPIYKLIVTRSKTKYAEHK